MKYQAHYNYNRIERRTFTFDSRDLLAALKAVAVASPFGPHPVGALRDTWDIEIDLYEGDEYRPRATLTQTFEYAAEAIPSEPAPSQEEP